MAGGILNFNVFILPLKLILGLIGPFPWTQFLKYKDIPAYSYQLHDYLQGIFNISFFITILMFWNEYFKKGWANLLIILGILLVISGLFNSQMHVTYVAIGFFFLIPWLLSNINFSKFIKVYLYSFLLLGFLNIIVLFFYGNLGISSYWK
jgi:hypothetical protein